MSAEQAAWYTKQVFIDVEKNKMTYDAKKVCERLGVDPLDLVEKTLAEFKSLSKINNENITP